MPNWMQTKYDITSSYIYIGTHTDYKANTSDSSWYIRKFVFDGDGNPTDKKKLIGSWDNRKSLDWGV